MHFTHLLCLESAALLSCGIAAVQFYTLVVNYQAITHHPLENFIVHQDHQECPVFTLKFSILLRCRNIVLYEGMGKVVYIWSEVGNRGGIMSLFVLMKYTTLNQEAGVHSVVLVFISSTSITHSRTPLGTIHFHYKSFSNILQKMEMIWTLLRLWEYKA